MEKIPLVYALHSGMMYGTERMALYTILGLADQFSATVFAPPGPLHEACQQMSIPTILFHNARQFSAALRPFLVRSPKLAFFATGVMHSLICIGWNSVYRRRIAHLHLVHGGAEERLSYGRKRLLNGTSVQFIAVSRYVQERLLAHRVRSKQITVIENFMTDAAVLAMPRRQPFRQQGIRRVAIVSRCDPEKRLDVLLDALEKHPDMHQLEFHIYGTGSEQDALRERIARSSLPVSMEGYRSDVAEQIRASDLLLHTCPVEPFGLAILEAIAAGVPVLVPNAGGAGSLIEPAISGFHFAANDPDNLAEQVRYIHSLPAEQINEVASNADHLLHTRFAESARIADYRGLLLRLLA
jgi:glycosyltransferase involved in cell wall biosynthesis